MNNIDYADLVSQRGCLEQTIAEAPKNAIISRMSLQSRLKSVQDEIEELEKKPKPNIQGKISFRGRPVVESRGIELAFATKIIESFQSVVATKAASMFSAKLSTSGKLPNRDQYALVITGIARGSFGFEFESRVSEEEFSECQNILTKFEDAIKKTIDFFNSINGTDEELAESLMEKEERLLKETRIFLNILSDNDAICLLEMDGREFCFKDVSEVKNCIKRLNIDNIHERDEKISGSFIGVLPHKRIFEFLTNSDDVVLSGKVSKEIDDPSTINNILHKVVTIKVHITQVGNSKPKYLLCGF